MRLKIAVQSYYDFSALFTLRDRWSQGYDILYQPTSSFMLSS